MANLGKRLYFNVEFHVFWAKIVPIPTQIHVATILCDNEYNLGDITNLLVRSYNNCVCLYDTKSLPCKGFQCLTLMLFTILCMEIVVIVIRYCKKVYELTLLVLQTLTG